MNVRSKNKRIHFAILLESEGGCFDNIIIISNPMNLRVLCCADTCGNNAFQKLALLLAFSFPRFLLSDWPVKSAGLNRSLVASEVAKR